VNLAPVYPRTTENRRNRSTQILIFAHFDSPKTNETIAFHEKHSHLVDLPLT